MKSTSFAILIFFFGTSLFAQLQIDWLDIVEEQQPDGSIHLYATNSGLCPITVIVDFDKLKNLKVKQKLPIKKVVRNNHESVLVATLIPQGNKSTGYNFSVNYRLGNIVDQKSDDHTYLLPFEHGTTCVVGQGYNGRFSHGGLNAIDFDMEVGSRVCAARDGIVIAVKEDSKTGCKTQRCQSMANYVLIYHEDGTFASYVHLKHSGVLVEVGDQVEAGQAIALSGNTGWSSGPHLHFEVYRPEEHGNKAIKTKFLIGTNKVEALDERRTYTAFHP